MITRESVSKNYMRGHGIDIGAFCNPFPVAYPTTIHYLDCKTVEEQKEILKDVDYSKVVTPHIIDDGELLTTIKDGTYDFLVSSHQLEHCMSPLTALENHLRVVKSGSYLFYAIPDKNHTFDKHRTVTPFCKLVGMYGLDPRDSKESDENRIQVWEDAVIDCYDEYLLKVDNISDQNERRKIGKERMLKQLDIHFFAWDQTSVYDFFYRAMVELLFPYQIELFYKNGHEIFVVIKKL